MIPFLTGRTLGETAFRWIVAALVLLLIVSLGYGFLSGKFWAMRAERAEQRAEIAAARAKIEAANAKGARDSAQNATMTRERIDRIVVDVRDNTGQRAERIESHANPADTGEPDPDVLRDIEDGEAEYRAAAARLQRSGTR